MNSKMALGAMLWVGAVAPFITGCATVTRGVNEVLVVESEPSGAAVRLSNGMVGTTPTSFKIPRKGDLHVTIIKEGYEVVDVNVHTQVAGAGAAGMAGNVLVGGLIGVGIDSFSGGMLEHKPNPVKVTLVPLATAVAAPAVAAPAVAPPAAAVPEPPPVSEMPVPEAPATVDPPEGAPTAEATVSEFAEKPTT
jgi:hypothetical protein